MKNNVCRYQNQKYILYGIGYDKLPPLWCSHIGYSIGRGDDYHIPNYAYNLQRDVNIDKWNSCPICFKSRPCVFPKKVVRINSFNHCGFGYNMKHKHKLITNRSKVEFKINQDEYHIWKLGVQK